MYGYVFVTKNDLTPTDQALAWVTDDVVYIEGASPADYGLYTVTCFVHLQEYELPADWQFEVPAEIVPHCAGETITQNGSIVFETGPRGSTQNFSVAGMFTFELSGVYDSYCDPIEYEVEPDADTKPDFLVFQELDGVPTITFSPNADTSVGSHNFVFQARLQKFASVTLDVSVALEVTDCVIDGFYASGPLPVGVQENPKTDLELTLTYIVGVDTHKTQTFEFLDFTVTEGDASCYSAFVQSYTVTVDGSDVLPEWIVDFDVNTPQLVLDTVNTAYVGYYDVVVSASVNTAPQTTSSTSISFVVVIKADPCLSA